MAAHRFQTDNCIGIVTLADIYEFEGFTFEFHRYLGPTKLRKDFEPAARAGKKFYDAVARWQKLTSEEQETTRIYG